MSLWEACLNSKSRIGFASIPLMLLIACPQLAQAHPELTGRIEAISEKIAADPKNPALYLQRGDLFRAHSDWTAAEKDFTKAASLDATVSEVDFFRGKMLQDMGELEEAKAALDRFLKAEPQSANGYVIRSRILTELDKPLDAAKDMDKALEHFTDPLPDLYLERAMLYRKAGVQFRDRTRSGLEEGITRFGPLVSIIEQLVDLELEIGRYEHALKYIERLPEAIKDQPQWLARRGDIYLALGKTQEALQAYKSALAQITALPARRRDSRKVSQLRMRLENQSKLIHSRSSGASTQQ
jgi:tetratricopeptide (TPR) repeat protein